MQDKILKYGDCTITRFDIVGSFFVYLFYNELYKKAKHLNQQPNKSLTDTYKELLTSYSEFTASNDFFKQAVKGIHNYVVTNTNQIDMTHKECIDFIVSEFVPPSIFKSLRDMHKNKLFHEALSSTVKQFICKLVSKYLKIVIDNRDSSNIVILQNEFLDIICTEKDNVYSKFIGGNPSEKISVALHKKKISEMKKEYESKIEALTAALDSQKKNSEALEAVNQKSSEIIKQLQSMIKSLKAKPEQPRADILVMKTKEDEDTKVEEDEDGSSLLSPRGNVKFDDKDDYY